mgnify:CR=1 FL=1
MVSGVQVGGQKFGYEVPADSFMVDGNQLQLIEVAVVEFYCEKTDPPEVLSMLLWLTESSYKL